MLALFVIIVLLLLGSALVKVLSTSSETLAQEVIGTRALMAANAGMQAHLLKTFPLNPDPLVAPACPANFDYNGFTNITGLKHCWARVTCNLYGPDDEGVSYFRLESTGECGSSAISERNSEGAVRSSRTIQVDARSL